MRELLFNLLYKNKDGTLDYNRLSRSMGMTKSELKFLINPDFTLIDSAELISGVLVGCHHISKNPKFLSSWDFKTCYNSPDDLAYITALIENRNSTINPYEFIIMNSMGNILFTNCKSSTSIDQQGVIKLSSETGSLYQYICPVSLKQRAYKCHYCHGSSIDKLNDQINAYIKKNFITKPHNFKGEFSISESLKEK